VANISASTSKRRLLVDLVTSPGDIIENQKTNNAMIRDKGTVGMAVAAVLNAAWSLKLRQLKEAISSTIGAAEFLIINSPGFRVRI